MAASIQLRRDTAANWASVNPILLAGEIGVEIDQSPPKFKIGDGATEWNSLAYEGNVFLTLTGDVTGSGTGSVATTIAPHAVTDAKLAQMPAATIKGNDTGSTADVADLTAAQVTAMLNLFSSSLQGLVPGSGGGTTNFLRADGQWAATPGGANYLAPLSVAMASSNFTLSNNTIYLVDTTSPRGLTLPVPINSAYIVVKDAKGFGNTNNITIIPNGSEKIEGATGNYVMNGTFEQAIFVSNGTDWFNIS